MAKKILILSIVLVLTFINFVYTLERPPEQVSPNEINKDAVYIESNEEGLQKIFYAISSRRLNDNSITTYRTGEIYVDIAGKTFTIPSSELQKIQPTAKEGVVFHLITITRGDLEKFLKEEGLNQDSIKNALNQPEKIDIRARIDIIQKGKLAASIKYEEDIETIAGNYGFIDKHFEDMRTRFKPANKPITPKKKETTPKAGLRPTIIVDDSEEDY